MNGFIIFGFVALTVMFLVLTVLFLALARQVGILLERVNPVGAMINNDGPAIGDQSDTFYLDTLDGKKVEIGTESGKKQLVFFLSPTCPVCKSLLPAIKDISKSEAWLNVVLASDGDPVVHRKFVQKNALEQLPYVISSHLGMTYHVSKLPYAVLLDETGVVLSKGLINSREKFESIFVAAESGYRSIQEFSLRNTVEHNV